MPVFIALYWVLMESVELRQKPFALWINDLSVMDPYFVLPILMRQHATCKSSISHRRTRCRRKSCNGCDRLHLFLLWFPAVGSLLVVQQPFIDGAGINRRIESAYRSRSSRPVTMLSGGLERIRCSHRNTLWAGASIIRLSNFRSSSIANQIAEIFAGQNSHRLLFSRCERRHCR